jgi:hypothetical protein
MRMLATHRFLIALLGFGVVSVVARGQQNVAPASDKGPDDGTASMGLDLLTISQTFGKPGDYTEYAIYFGERPEESFKVLVVSKSGKDVWLELVPGGGQFAMQVLLGSAESGAKIKEQRMRYGQEVFLMPPTGKPKVIP